MNRAATPVIRDVESVFKEPLPEAPLVVHLTAEQWTELSEGLAVSKLKIGPDAKGLFVLPDPFGGFMAVFACAAGSDEGVACIPEIISDRGTITFGRGCTCIRGKETVERPAAEEDSCALGFTSAGKLTCVGTCARGRTCQLVRKPRPGGASFVTCECS